MIIRPGLSLLTAAIFVALTLDAGIATAAPGVALSLDAGDAGAAPVADLLAPPTLQLDPALQDYGVETYHHHTFMGTVARNALGGALAGLLIGTAVWLLDTPRHDTQNIGFWTAGGALVGAVIGVAQLMGDENPSARLGDRYATTGPATAYLVPALSVKY